MPSPENSGSAMLFVQQTQALFEPFLAFRTLFEPFLQQLRAENAIISQEANSSRRPTTTELAWDLINQSHWHRAKQPTKDYGAAVD